jgi:SAM-dependent methyltransferase
VTRAAEGNQEFVDFWTGIATPKWVRFRHILSGNGKIHSDIAADDIGVRPGDRVLDVGCGFGETCLELSQRVGPDGRVVGLDCAPAFLEIAERERAAAGAGNVRYVVDDIELCREVEEASFDVVFARFGIMFCNSPVRALRSVRRVLVPGGRFRAIVWRAKAENQCWATAEAVALEHVPRPGDQAATCGPGPFSMSDRDTVQAMLDAAGLADAGFRRIDADLCMGTSLDEAIDFQVAVGPAGFVIREAGDAGTVALPAIREHLARVLAPFVRADGGVWMSSSTWLISATRPL